MHRKEPRAQPPGAIDALVDAERTWRAHLDEVRVDAAALVAGARDDAARIRAAAPAALAPLVERRGQELEARLATDVAGIARRGRLIADRYSSASDDAVRALATRIARRVPWLAEGGAAEAAR